MKATEAVKEKILILDFGSQYTQLIARRVRELKVYCEIHPCTMALEDVRAFNPTGIILSGGPASIYGADAPTVSPEIYDVGAPVLGICYGLQLTAHLLGGVVRRSDHREYGFAEIDIRETNGLFAGFDRGETQPVWMSHGDRVDAVPQGFSVIATSANSPIAAMRNEAGSIYGVQFHPEVVHTPRGSEILSNFVHRICGCGEEWTMAGFIESSTRELAERIGDKRVILGLSGGVDSSVTAMLLHRAIGGRLTSIFVNNGVLRKNEAEQVLTAYRDKLGLHVNYVDASERFLSELAGVTEPEQKRKIIGRVFIEVFTDEAKKIEGAEFLAQGTLYPDVIESVSFKGRRRRLRATTTSAACRNRSTSSSSNRCVNCSKMKCVRWAGSSECPARCSAAIRFPAPGSRCAFPGKSRRSASPCCRRPTRFLSTRFAPPGWYDRIWQAFAVLLPVRSVGVMGDERSYENVVALRAVHSKDGMTADWVHLPYELLARVSSRIINEVRGVNRVVYDISSKPPATIEWE
ncbi:MAG: glutamine-hydrolyzing GMP synthase [Deltaproteobacteria bacterium]|nr:glutamine-hydrolyzing GMP synthase [Deltaproteobacteria bacterium]